MKIFGRQLSGFVISLVLITILGGVLRLVKLDDYPGGISQDEVVAGYDAWCLLTTGHDHHGDLWPLNPRMFGDYPTGIATYLTIPGIALFGPTVFAIRSICAILSVAAIPLFALLARRLFRDQAIALFAAAILAVSPWNILFSRNALAPGFISFFLAAGLLMYHRLLEDPDERKRSYGAAMITGVAVFLWTQIYAAQYFFVPGMLLVGALLWQKNNWRRLFMVAGVYTLLMLVAMHVRLQIPAATGRLHRHSILFGEHRLETFVANYLQYVSFKFLFHHPLMEPLHQIPRMAHINHYLQPLYFVGLAAVVAAIVVPVRLLQAMGKPANPDDAAGWRRSAIWLLAWMVLGPIAGALFIQPMYTPRVVQLLMGILMVIALGCTVTWHLLKRLPLKAVAPIFAVVLAGYLGQQTIRTVRLMIRANPEFREYFQYGVPEVMGYLGQQTNVQSVLFSGLNQAYIYHLFFTPVHPKTLKPMAVSPPGSPDPSQWSYIIVPQIGRYHFNVKLDPDEIAKHAVLRHQVADENRIWFDLYENKGIWYVLDHKK